MFKSWIFLALFLIGINPIFSQGGSVRIAVYGGGNVNFVFNSIGAYSSGITYNNFTLLGIDVQDPVALPDYTTWELRFLAADVNVDNNFNGINPANTLPLSVVEVKATISAGCASCNCFLSPFISLSNASQVLVDGNALGGADDITPATGLSTSLDQINLSYQCGVGAANNLFKLSPSADYYADDMYLDLIMSP